MQTHAAYVTESTEPLSVSFENSERSKHVQRFLVTSLLLASGLGANGYLNTLDYLSFWIPSGMTTAPFGTNKITLYDKCKLTKYTITNNQVNPIVGTQLCTATSPPEY